MTTTSRRLTLTAAALLTSPATAFAHPGHGGFAGFPQGFMHPLTGLDHILAMVMVGVLAARLARLPGRERALWLVPAAFVTLMALGGGLGMAGVGLPFVELGIGLSVVVLGAAVALNVTLAPLAGMALVGFFALFHGYAHGAEMPDTAAGLAYAGGFVAATIILHAAGIALGMALTHAADPRAESLIRATGAVAAIAGVAITSGVL